MFFPSDFLFLKIRWLNELFLRLPNEGQPLPTGAAGTDPDSRAFPVPSGSEIHLEVGEDATAGNRGRRFADDMTN